jgi:hypothetical protein
MDRYKIDITGTGSIDTLNKLFLTITKSFELLPNPEPETPEAYFQVNNIIARITLITE